MPRQAFNDFLNSPGPSTPRGRGGGRGKGRGRGGVADSGNGSPGFRGGRGGGNVLGGSSRSFKADYSNVGFDYTAVNRQQYIKMDGFNVTPYGSTESPGTPHGYGRGRGRGAGAGGSGGSYTPRGRGRGGGLGFNADRLHTPQSTSAQDSPGASGSATPVTGIGYKGKGKSALPGAADMGTSGAPPGRMTSTVGRGIGTGDVTWGGRKGAPMFIKAGELFKDGEVDLVTGDQDKAIDIASLPPPNSPGPHLPGVGSDAKAALPDGAVETGTIGFPFYDGPSSSTSAGARDGESQREIVPDGVADGADAPEEPDRAPAAPIACSEPIASNPLVLQQMEATMTDDSDAAGIIEDFPEIIIDTAPRPVFEASSAIYTSHLFVPIGSGAGADPQSDDEEIVFKPKQFPNPVPVHINISANSSNLRSSSIVPELVQTSTDPRAKKPPMSRKDKKAAKREKRKQRGTARRRGMLKDDFGAEDDIDWGSDGPPKGLKGVEGLEEDLPGRDADADIAILRDYLEGTRLNQGKDSEDGENAAFTAAMDEMAGKRSSRSKGKGRVNGKGNDKGKGTAQPRSGAEADDALAKGRERQSRGATGWDDSQAAAVHSNSHEEDSDEWEDEVDDTGPDPAVPSNLNEGGSTGEDSDESSVVGDLQAIMNALDAYGDDDDENDMDTDDAALFEGKNAWTSEDEGDWFIRNMEDALGVAGSSSSNPRANKTNRVLFSSIENGDFDLDLPTEPVKKGKKKAQGIPEALQEQWESDRQRKAFKKEQRQLERLIAEIEGGKTSRRKGKGTSKAQQASLAHLIPASASQVADMFDIDSEDEDALGGYGGGGRRGMSKMRKMLNLPPMLVSAGLGGSAVRAGEMEAIVEQIRDFIDDAGRTTFALHPMEKAGRERMHMLAECFGLKSNSKGKGKARFTIMIKTSRTGLVVDEERISRLISASSFSGGQFYKALYSRGGAGGTARGGKKGPGDRGSSTRAKEGDLVGEGAEKIGESNMGHKLLSKMGWAEGGKIGRTDGGLTNPIVAVVKYTKSGLGA